MTDNDRTKRGQPRFLLVLLSSVVLATVIYGVWSAMRPSAVDDLPELAVGDEAPPAEPEEDDDPKSTKPFGRDEDPPPRGAVVFNESAQFWHDTRISFAAFLPDGKTLVTLAGNELLHWNVPSGQLRSRLRLSTLERHVQAAALSGDGKTLATSGFGGRGVRLWDRETGHGLGTPMVLTKLLATPNRLRFSPDGRLLAVDEGGQALSVALFRSEDSQRIATFEGHADSLIDLVFSNNGETILAASLDGKVHEWSIATGKKSSWRIDAWSVAGGAFSRDGRFLALSEGQLKGRVGRFYDVAKRALLFEFGDGTDGSPRGIQDRLSIGGFSSDGRFVTIDNEGEYRVWDPKTGKATIGVRPGATNGMLSWDGELIAGVNGRRMVLVEVWSRDVLTRPIFRTYLRPVVSKLADGDAFRVAVHWAAPKGDGDFRIRGLLRDQRPFDGKYMRVDTLNSMIFHVVTPSGTQYDLRARVMGNEPRGFDHGIRDWPSYFFTLSSDGLKTAEQYNAYSGPWLHKKPPSFDEHGVYKISVSGTLVLKPYEPVPFCSGEVQIERVANGLLPLTEIRERAAARLATALGLKRASFFSDFHDRSGPIDIVDDRAGNRVVALVAHSDNWYVNRFQVRVAPNGRILRVSSFREFMCVAAGSLIDTDRGRRPVEQLGIGDRVWAYDLDEARPVLASVRAIRSATAAKTLRFPAGARMTAEHPVFASGEWKAAARVRPDDQLHSIKGEPITAGRAQEVEESVVVYDLTVDGPHNFFADGILVHNKDMSFPIGYFDPWTAFRASEKPYVEAPNWLR